MKDNLLALGLFAFLAIPFAAAGLGFSAVAAAVTGAPPNIIYGAGYWGMAWAIWCTWFFFQRWTDSAAQRAQAVAKPNPRPYPGQPD